MTDQKRPYRMKQRAESEALTRLRITESAVELHGTLGPARTSISAIAEHAGVRRSTVYRHFPDEAALLAACSSHWRALNPPPGLEQWSAVESPDKRLRLALEELYAHYRHTERMRENVLRDEAALPVLTPFLAGYRAYLAQAADALARGRTERGDAGRRVHAAIGHAVGFATWQSLARGQGLDDAEAADLMCRLVYAARAATRRGTGSGSRAAG
jgi:AcrR family transcriptional regulator